MKVSNYVSMTHGNLNCLSTLLRADLAAYLYKNVPMLLILYPGHIRYSMYIGGISYIWRMLSEIILMFSLLAKNRKKAIYYIIPI